MLVYGSPSRAWASRDLAAKLHGAARALRYRTDPPLTSELRALLIYAGQLEQGLSDALDDGTYPAPFAVTLSRYATAGAAAALYHGGMRARVALATSEFVLKRLQRHEDVRLRITVPEGYAYHGLYPEQYVGAAHAWARTHTPEPSGYALVVGLRTIGTSLAAMVAAVLRACGYATVTTTLRPTGHPYARSASINARLVRRASAALIVDEGPGRSGSSMAATAQALVEAGLARGRIAFLPSHQGEPGPAAAETIREWWLNTPRHVGASRCSKDADLIAHLIDPFTEHDPVARIDEVGGGLWRRHAYSHMAEWPAVCAPFEAPKFLYILRSGRQLLAKFAGLNLAGPALLNGAESAAGQMERTARLGIGLMPCGVAEGFVVMPWLRGRHLTPRDASASVLTELGRYIALSAGTPLAAEEHEAGLRRLCDIVSTNVARALDPAAGAAAQCLTERVVPELLRLTSRRASGDGHVAPHEWLSTAAGALCKTDNAGSTLDGTCVGVQSDAWDVAGIAVEWELDDQALAKVMQAYHAAGGAAHTDAEVNFHRLAYAAFRAGQCVLGMDVEADADERDRLSRALARYRSECARSLAASHD